MTPNPFPTTQKQDQRARKTEKKKKIITYDSICGAGSDGKLVVSLIILVKKICKKKSKMSSIKTEKGRKERIGKKKNMTESKLPRAFLPISE